MKIRRIMIAAPKSGSGKTTVTCGLLQICKNYEEKVSACKCGPDYIDPMFHEKILDVPSKNLDTFFSDALQIQALYEMELPGHDIAVLEGVMGLYDGLGGIREEASSYALAKATNTPILLTVNARGMGRSLLALLSGFLQYDTAHLIKGVILNQTPSSFASVLAKEIEETFHIPVVASFPVRDDVRIESRHLGLVMPYELEDIQSRLKIASQVLCENANIEQILEIAKSAPKLEYDVKRDIKQKLTEKTIRIGVARDEAFCFYYEDNLDLLKSLGAKLIFFSPLHDDTLPKDLDGILFGGGYPELYLKELEENESMRNSVKSAIENKMPSLAECGGFMYLHEIMEDSDKNEHGMVGIIKGTCRKTDRLQRFGYMEMTANRDNILCKKGDKIRAREFHYFDSDCNGNGFTAVKNDRQWECVNVDKNLFAGFPHLHFFANINFAENFMKSCEEYKCTKSEN